MNQPPLAGITFEKSKTRITTQQVESRKIVFVGLTGSGKSSIIASLLPVKNDHIAQTSIKSITKNITLYANNKITSEEDKKEYVIDLFDTVGLGDTNVTVPEILKQIVDLMPTELSKIHKIIFCFRVDRLRARMSEELTTVYNFFKLLGAQSENFVMCLTFCDILSDETIGVFWKELQAYDDLPMTREINSVTYTSFPNISECIQHQELLKFLQEVIDDSKARVFKSIIQKPATAFYPHSTMIKMDDIKFDELCAALRKHKKKDAPWYKSLFSSETEQDQMLRELGRLRDKSKDSPRKVPP
jgi:GTPase SAR1 family protein